MRRKVTAIYFVLPTRFLWLRSDHEIDLQFVLDLHRAAAADDRHAAAEMSYFPNSINVEGYPSGSIVAPECCSGIRV
jgi:hypothetical protein